MTAFHALQAGLLTAVMAVVVHRTWALFGPRALDAPTLRRALVDLVRRGRLDEARRLVSAARPAPVLEPAWALIDPTISVPERAEQVDDRLFELETQVERGLRLLRVAGRVASAIGFVAAAVEIHWVFTGDHGLKGLQAGLIESIGMSRAFLSIAFGMATSSLALGSWGVLRKQARSMVADAHRVVASLEDELERGPE